MVEDEEGRVSGDEGSDRRRMRTCAFFGHSLRVLWAVVHADQGLAPMLFRKVSGGAFARAGGRGQGTAAAGRSRTARVRPLNESDIDAPLSGSTSYVPHPARPDRRELARETPECLWRQLGEFGQPGSKNTAAENRESRGRSGTRAKHFVSQAMGSVFSPSRREIEAKLAVVGRMATRPSLLQEMRCYLPLPRPPRPSRAVILQPSAGRTSEVIWMSFRLLSRAMRPSMTTSSPMLKSYCTSRSLRSPRHWTVHVSGAPSSFVIVTEMASCGRLIWLPAIVAMRSSTG